MKADQVSSQENDIHLTRRQTGLTNSLLAWVTKTAWASEQTLTCYNYLWRGGYSVISTVFSQSECLISYNHL